MSGRWEHAPAWPHWCPVAQIANLAEPHGVLRIWDPGRRDWFWMGPGNDGQAGEQTIREARHAWGRVRGVTLPETWRLSWFRGLEDTAPKHVDRTLDQAARKLTTFSRGGKDSLPLWSPAAYREDGKRQKADVESVSMLVLDYDDGTAIADAEGVWGPWAHVVYTTPSHQADAPRFRVVLPLAEPVVASEWLRVWLWAEQRAGKAIDKSCKDQSRMYFGHGGEDPKVGYAVARLDRPLLWVDLERLPKIPPRPQWTPLPRPPRRTISAFEAMDEAHRLLRTCPDTRRRAGELAGGSVTEGNIRGVACPKCGRPSVWWPIEPLKVPTAMCSHRKTCDWTGPIAEVLP